MSNNTVTVPDFARLDVVQQRIALSLLGHAAWRMYRDGLQPGLIWDLQANDMHVFDRLRYNAYAIVERAVGTQRFPDAASLGDFIMSKVRLLNEAEQMSFEGMTYLLPPRLMHALGLEIYSWDESAETVAHLIRFMDDAAHGQGVVGSFLLDLATIWCEICDVALDA